MNDNTATDEGEGGGFYIDDGNNTFSNNTVNGNQATGEGYGGGFYIDDGTNTFSGDSASGATPRTAGAAALHRRRHELVHRRDHRQQHGGSGRDGQRFRRRDLRDDGTDTFTGDSVNDNDAIWVGGDTAYGGGLDVSEMRPSPSPAAHSTRTKPTGAVGSPSSVGQSTSRRRTSVPTM